MENVPCLTSEPHTEEKPASGLKKCVGWMNLCGFSFSIFACSVSEQFHFFKKGFIYFIFIRMSVFPACIYVHRAHAWCQWSSEEDGGFPGPRDIYGCGPLCGCWELNPGPLQDQQVLFKFRAISPSLYAHFCFCIF